MVRVEWVAEETSEPFIDAGLDASRSRRPVPRRLCVAVVETGARVDESIGGAGQVRRTVTH